MYYENLIPNERHDTKKMWNILHAMLGRKVKSTPSFLEMQRQFITKPLHIANHLNNCFIKKINKSRGKMNQIDNTKSNDSMKT